MRLLFMLLLLAGTGHLYAQEKDSVVYSGVLLRANNTEPMTKQKAPGLKPTIRTLIVPVSLIAYGVISQTSEDLKEFDMKIKTQVRKKDPDFHTSIDNYLQYAPGLAVYALNVVGIRGTHNFRDRTLLYLLSNIIMAVPVQAIKKITKVPRPEGFGTNAFPSGHTATAFVGAEFLRQEYKDVSPWYGIAGYTVATATGILRMYNNKHWFRDVVAGAGFGILSTQLAYWLEPKIAKIFIRKRGSSHFNTANL